MSSGKLVAVVEDLVRVLGARGERDPVAGAEGDLRLADAQGPGAAEHVQGFLVRAVIVAGERRAPRGDLEEIAADAAASRRPPEPGDLRGELVAVCIVHGLELVRVDDVRVPPLRLVIHRPLLCD